MRIKQGSRKGKRGRGGLQAGLKQAKRAYEGKRELKRRKCRQTDTLEGRDRKWGEGGARRSLVDPH